MEDKIFTTSASSGKSYDRHQDDLFGSFFEHQDQRIGRLGNPLPELDKNIDWEAFCLLLDQVCLKKRKSSVGKRSWEIRGDSYPDTGGHVVRLSELGDVYADYELGPEFVLVLFQELISRGSSVSPDILTVYSGKC